jgi:hypothetical protein
MSNKSVELRTQGFAGVSDEDLKLKMKELRDAARHWMDSQDGSYEMALEEDGYNAYREEYQRRRAEKNG